MHLPNTANQPGQHRKYDASGTTTAGQSILVLPEQVSRSMLLIQNISDTDMYLEIGPARATAALTSGAVSSVTITNGGFNYTLPPIVEFLGGATGVSSTLAVAGQANIHYSPGAPGFPLTAGGLPARPAQGVAVLTGGVVTSISITDGGAGYVAPPLVRMTNAPQDPFGCADAFFGSVTRGIPLFAGGGSYYVNGTVCTTDALAIYCSASSKAFTLKWMP